MTSPTRNALAALWLALAPAAAASEANRAAPECELVSLPEAQPYRLQASPGKVVWVNFWASWCGPCAESFAFLNELDREYRERGLQVLGISVDEKRGEALGFLQRHPASFALAADASGRCPRAFGVSGMPASYLIDRRGVIRSVHVGFRAGQEAALREQVRALLAEGGAADAAPAAAEAP